MREREFEACEGRVGQRQIPPTPFFEGGKGKCLMEQGKALATASERQGHALLLPAKEVPALFFTLEEETRALLLPLEEGDPLCSSL